MAELLLRHGADVQALCKDVDGWTALHGAAKYGHQAMPELLLQQAWCRCPGTEPRWQHSTASCCCTWPPDHRSTAVETWCRCDGTEP